MKYEYKQGALIFSLFPYYFCEVSSFTLRNKAKMRFLIVADFSLQQRGKYTESFLIISGFEKKMRLSQDFFIGCNNIVSRRQGLCFGAGDTRAATGKSVCIHHPRLRYAHLGLIRFDLFEVVNDGAAIPLQRFCQSMRSPRTASTQDGCVQTMPTCSADAMNRVPTICF